MSALFLSFFGPLSFCCSSPGHCYYLLLLATAARACSLHRRTYLLTYAHISSTGLHALHDRPAPGSIFPLIVRRTVHTRTTLAVKGGSGGRGRIHTHIHTKGDDDVEKTNTTEYLVLRCVRYGYSVVGRVRPTRRRS
jgi:hypothetical protein